MLEMGLLVAMGLLAVLAKLPWKWKLFVVSHPLAIDAIVFIALTAMHWGTFSGVMVATIGAFFCSLVLSLARRVIGHTNDDGTYVRGWMDVSSRVS